MTEMILNFFFRAFSASNSLASSSVMPSSITDAGNNAKVPGRIDEFGHGEEPARLLSAKKRTPRFANHSTLQRSLEQRDGNAQRHRREDAEEQHVSPHSGERGFFQQQALEAVDGIGKGVGLRYHPQPRRKGLD